MNTLQFSRTQRHIGKKSVLKKLQDLPCPRYRLTGTSEGAPMEVPWRSLVLRRFLGSPLEVPWRSLGGSLGDPLDIPWRSLGNPLEVPWRSLGDPLEDQGWAGPWSLEESDV